MIDLADYEFSILVSNTIYLKQLRNLSYYILVCFHNTHPRTVIRPKPVERPKCQSHVLRCKSNQVPNGSRQNCSKHANPNDVRFTLEWGANISQISSFFSYFRAAIFSEADANLREREGGT